MASSKTGNGYNCTATIAILLTALVGFGVVVPNICKCMPFSQISGTQQHSTSVLQCIAFLSVITTLTIHDQCLLKLNAKHYSFRMLGVTTHLPTGVCGIAHLTFYNHDVLATSFESALHKQCTHHTGVNETTHSI